MRLRKKLPKQSLDALEVAYRLLKKHIKDDDKAVFIAIKLVKTIYTHSHIIDKEDAKEIGLNIIDDEDSIKSLVLYKKWVASKLSVNTTTHVLEYYMPDTKQKENGQEKPKQTK